MEKDTIWSKTASAIFHRAIKQVLGDIKNMVFYQDDIGIGASNENESKKKPTQLNRLSNAGMTINEKNAQT